MANFFNQEASLSYDEKNKRLAPIADAMHFLIKLTLSDLPDDARILCVGVGTGAEILALALEYPNWTFVGVDPSAAMLEVCSERLKVAGIEKRCTLMTGYIHDVEQGEQFDAAVSVLVGHFIKKEDRNDFYGGMYDRLKSGGRIVITELSFDLDSAESPSVLKNWEKVQALMGATPESLQRLPQLLRDPLTVLPPEEVVTLLKNSGFSRPVHFFQAFLINGWYAVKE